MAANQNFDGLDADSAILDDYVPPTPQERGDYVVEDEPEDELEDELEEDELEEDEPEEDEPEDEPEDEEDADEDEVDPDAPQDDEAPEEKGAKSKTKRQVPLDRLNKEIGKRRALEAELSQLRDTVDTLKAAPAASKVEAPSEPESFTREDFESMQEAMLDGETDKAFDIFGKMMATQSKATSSKTEKEVAERVRNEINQDRAMSELRETAATLAAQYPELDSAGDDADEGLIEEVVEMRDLYVDRGLTPAQALKKSVRLVALENALVDRTAKPKADMARPTKKVNSKAKLEAAKRENGKLSGTGGRNGRPEINIGRLSDEEFGKLSAEAKATARGDYV
ncbi:hypothetical protein HC000_02035 [Pseudoalteromonas sp. MIP2626]|uniref:hypothetical protein n=1 Tax=Pseudoalteromonas sp. MIP2626 TaxID=2705464 RepID=UPI0015C74CEB|nr:hypothetical protein [Pseudoalteromonas sp. MIP2626]NYR11279.1 hypothetical protein [Pseudoalteromonas sp. MIP2626]